MMVEGPNMCGIQEEDCSTYVV